MNLNVFVIVMIMMTERDRELLYSGFRDHAVGRLKSESKMADSKLLTEMRKAERLNRL